MIDKNMNTYVEQAMDTFVRHSLMSDEFLDFVKDNTKPLLIISILFSIIFFTPY